MSFVLDFLHKAENIGKDIVQPAVNTLVNKPGNELLAIGDLLHGDSQGAQQQLQPGGGLGHQGGILQGRELSNDGVFIGPNAGQNIRQTAGAGAQAASYIVAPEAGATVKGGKFGLDFLKGAEAGAGAGVTGAGGQELSAGQFDPTLLAEGAAFGGALGGAGQVAGRLIDHAKAAKLAKSDNVKQITKDLQEDVGPVVANNVAQAVAQAKDANIVQNIVDNEVNRLHQPAPPPAQPEAIPTATTTAPVEAGAEAGSASPAGQQLISHLEEAQKTRLAQDQGYTPQRQQKLAASQSAGQNLEGSQGYFSELGALKGQLDKKDYAGLSEHLDDGQKESLFSSLRGELKQNPSIAGSYSDINAQTALRKVIYGDQGVPTAGEIKLLQNAFGKDFGEAVKQSVEDHAQKQTLMQKAGSIAGVPRAIMASADFSAALRQGLAISTRHPVIAGKAFVDQFKPAFSEKSYQDLQSQIIDHPNFPLAQQAKLAIMDASQHTPGANEEQFVSSAAEKIPGLGKIIHGSNRAYTAFLDSTRFNVFNNIADRAKDAGIDFATPEGDKILKQIGEVVNTSSGRGSLGALEEHAGALSTALFAPRLIASRIQMLNPQYYIKLDPIARREALTTLASLGATAGSILGLADLAGAKVSMDPTNADFGKIRVGDTRFDILGGYQQYLRLGAQLAEGKITSSTTGSEVTLGDGFGKPTRLDITNRFLEGKENPVLSFATTLLQGKDAAGNKISVPKEVVSRFIPLLAQDISDLATHPNSAGPAAAAGGLFGVGLQTYGSQDMPVTDKQQGYLDTLKQQGTPQSTVADEKQFFQTLRIASGRQQNVSDQINQDLAQGDVDAATQAANDYNQKLIATLNPVLQKRGDNLDPTLVNAFQQSLITLDNASIQQRLQGILANPRKYGNSKLLQETQ